MKIIYIQSTSLKFVFFTLLALVLSLLIFQSIQCYALPVAISLVDLCLIIFALTTKYFRHIIFKIYFAYHILTMLLPLIYIVLFYTTSEIDLFFSYKLKIDENNLIKSNLIILMYDALIISSVVFYNRINLLNKPVSKMYNYFLFNGNKYFLILVMVLLSYAMKYYLISIGAWFMYEQIDSSKYPFASLAGVLEKLDILVLLYFSYSYKYNSGKIFLILMIFVTIFSLFFAVLSTSKAKLFIILIPIALLLVQTRYKKTFLLLILFLFFNSGIVFQYMGYMRLNSTSSFFDNTTSFMKYNITSNSTNILDNSLLQRLGYQFVFSRAIEVYDTSNLEYKSNYLNNIIGLIPRFIWPSKPIMGANGNQWGHDLGLLGKADRKTSVGIRPIGEAFYELGYLGIFIIPWFIGFLLYAFAYWFKKDSWIGYLMAIMMGLALGISDKYTTLIPGLIKLFIVFYIFGLLLNRQLIGNEIKLRFRLKH